MKALILCGGKGKRLRPITYSLPKQLIPIANKPLLVYTIDALLNAGIKEIGIVVNRDNKLIFQQVLSQHFNEKFQYIVQGSPKGIADGVLNAEEFIEKEKFIMVLGDNSFQFNFKKFIDNFLDSEDNCRILLKKVKNPESFGVAYIGNNKIINLEEKPKVAFSDLAITGLYAFDSNIFNACKEVELSSRGEYEITDAIKWLLGRKYGVGYEILDGEWKDVGEVIDVLEENIFKLSNLEKNIKGEIIDSNVTGEVVLQKGSVIYNSVVRGPTVVGKDSIIKYSYIGPYTSIGERVKINKSNIEGSILLNDCVINGIGTMIDESIIGEGSIITNYRGLKKVNSFVIGRNNKIYL